MDGDVEEASVNEGWDCLFNRVDRLKMDLLKLRTCVPTSIRTMDLAPHQTLDFRNESSIVLEDIALNQDGDDSLRNGSLSRSRSENVEALQLQMTSLLIEKLDSEEGWLKLHQEQRLILDQMDSLTLARDAAESLAVELNLQIMDRNQRIADMVDRLQLLEKQLEERAGDLQRHQQAYDGMTVRFDRLRNSNEETEQLNAELRLALHQKDRLLDDVEEHYRIEIEGLIQKHESLREECDGKERAFKSKLEADLLEREHQYCEKLQVKDDEIARLNQLVEKNSLLTKTVTDLHRELDTRTKDFGSSKNLAIATFHAPLSYSRVLSASQNSLPNRPSLEDEPECALESTNIPHRTSFSSMSRVSISSRNESQPFKYKETTPTRLEELDRRNKAQLPHLKSSYPVESTAPEWRHNQDESDGSPKEEPDSGSVSLLEHQQSEGVKKGFLQKLQSSFKTSAKGISSRKDKRLGKENNPVPDLVKEPNPIPAAKPVAFVVDITPEKKKKKKKW